MTTKTTILCDDIECGQQIKPQDTYFTVALNKQLRLDTEKVLFHFHPQCITGETINRIVAIDTRRWDHR